jgi:hypothetical protein
MKRIKGAMLHKVKNDDRMSSYKTGWSDYCVENNKTYFTLFMLFISVLVKISASLMRIIKISSIFNPKLVDSVVYYFVVAF